MKTEHLLLGVMSEQHGVGGQLLRDLGLTFEMVRKEVAEALQDGMDGIEEYDDVLSETGRGEKPNTPSLDMICEDLSETARTGSLGPVVGHEKEIGQTIQILARHAPRSVLLLGKSRFCSSMIVAGVARCIRNRATPHSIANKRLVAIDPMTLLTRVQNRAGLTNLAGRIAIEASQDNELILVMEQLRAVVVADDPILRDAFRLLKCGIAGSQIQCISNATVEDFRQYIEHDVVLRDCFELVTVAPSTEGETVEILRALRDRIERHHQANISEEAIQAAVELSSRHITTGCLPDIAIDVLDEAGALSQLKSIIAPPDTTEIDSRVQQFDLASEEAIATQDFERAAALRHQTVALRKQKVDAIKLWRMTSQETPREIDAEVVAEVVARMTAEMPDHSEQTP